MNDPLQVLIDSGAIPTSPFDAQSRYSGVALGVLQRRADEPGQPYVLRRFIGAPSAFTLAAVHVAAALDRPDALGMRYLADPLLYWRIADANAVIDPNELTDTLGRRVAIPVITGT